VGKALQVVSGRVTNPGATITALTVDTGDSFQIKNAVAGSVVQLMNVWAQEATVGIVRVRSPLMHDQAQAVRLRVTKSAEPLLPYEETQPLQPQDVVTFELSGGGAETDCASMLLFYASLGGADARLATWTAIAPLIVNTVGVEANLTTGATAGQYGGSQALNANFDILQRTKDYALLGYLCDTTVCTVGFTGPDTGNLRLGGPGIAEPIITRDWFAINSYRTGLPLIPIINAANIGATLIDLVATQTATAVNVTALLAELNVAGGTLAT
jgi:hypothetical protein